MPDAVRFVVDTNLFHECISLDAPDFPWADAGSFDSIELVVCDVVQSELDRHKKDNRPRIKKRAVTVISWFRAMLKAGEAQYVLREAGPRVTLTITTTPTSREHPDVLDLTVDDDKIVGVAAALVKAHPGEDIRLLTDDTRPASKASALGLPYLFVPDSWLRPPEADEQTKETAELKAQIKKLTALSPVLELSAEGATDGRLMISRQAWAELTDNEAEEVRAALMKRAPLEQIEAQFARAKAANRPSAWQFGRGDVEVVPPSAQAIARYRDVDYPAWLEASIDKVRTIPGLANPRMPTVRVSFQLVNRGSQPAQDVRIRITAKGRFLIAPDDTEVIPELGGLPQLPDPPTETWMAGGSPVGEVTRPRIAEPSLFPHLAPLGPLINPREDEEWYYDPDRPEAPVKTVSLVCRRFRHGPDMEAFDIVLYPTEQVELLKGSIEVEVSASNLPEQVTAIFPVEVATTFGPLQPLVTAYLSDKDPIKSALNRKKALF